MRGEGGKGGPPPAGSGNGRGRGLRGIDRRAPRAALPGLLEATESTSPNSAGFSAEGGRAEWIYYCDGDQVIANSADLLGWVEPKGDGTLTRRLPRVNAQYPWLVTTILNNRGEGVVDTTMLYEQVPSDADNDLLPPPVPDYVRYLRYGINVTAESVSYNVYPDSDITMSSGTTWYDDTGASKSFSYANEYIRFTDWPRYPATEFLQFKQGQMVFRTKSHAKPNGYAMAGTVRMPLRKQFMKAMWYRVPESYVTHADSYLDRFLWRVNQNPVTFGGETFTPGQLLYAGYTFPKRNNPPFPDEDPDWPGFFINAKVLDVELSFIICRWQDDDAPGDGAPTWQIPENRNFIAAGHNLDFSAATRRPHYVSTQPLLAPVPPSIDETVDPDQSKWMPKYFSAPMELLFTDPAFAQDIGVLRQ